VSSISSRQSRQLVFLFWALPAIVAAYGMHIVSVRYNPGLIFAEKLGAQLLMWMSWGLWSLVIFALLDRFVAAESHWSRIAAALVPLCALVVLVQIFVYSGVTWLYALGETFPFTSTIAVGMRMSGAMFVVTFWAIVGTHAAIRWYEAWRMQSLIAAQLTADLTAAQLRALKAQLNPHFLFNALNSVVTLIAKEPASAERMVVRLSDLLRGTLALSSEQEVSLKRELELAAQYLEIEQIRFRDRLVVTWKIDEHARDAAVPALALQPLVENAIVHGTSRITGCGTIVVAATVDGSALRISVRDNGYGPSAAGAKPGTGIGLANLRERLSRLYGESASLTLADAEGGGALAVLTLPFRAASQG
jgi:signal transduction histidine kinase